MREVDEKQEISLLWPYTLSMPARTSEQGNVIGLVSMYKKIL